MRLSVGFGSLWVSDLYPSFLTGREWVQKLREGERMKEWEKENTHGSNTEVSCFFYYSNL